MCECQELLNGLSGVGNYVQHEEFAGLNPIRKQIVTQIILLFHLMSASLHTKSPVPHFLPDAKVTLEKLYEAFLRSPVFHTGVLLRGRSQVTYYFAYAVAVYEIVKDLEYLLSIAKSLFGEVGYVPHLETVPQS